MVQSILVVPSMKVPGMNFEHMPISLYLDKVRLGHVELAQLQSTCPRCVPQEELTPSLE